MGRIKKSIINEQPDWGKYYKYIKRPKRPGGKKNWSTYGATVDNIPDIEFRIKIEWNERLGKNEIVSKNLDSAIKDTGELLLAMGGPLSPEEEAALPPFPH